MKIGILTHPLDNNYGCLFQAFALQKVLRDNGHDAITINRHSNKRPSILIRVKSWIKRIYYRIVKHQNVSIRWSLNATHGDLQSLTLNTMQFVERNIKNTGVVYSKDLGQIDKSYMFDAYVVGSDQVWLPHFAIDAFLNFVKRDDVIRIFYAASTGAVSFADAPKILSKCQRLVKKFSAISVRESNLIQISEKYLNKPAIQVLDPTLLLSAEDYIKTCIESENDEPAVFAYILDGTEDKYKLLNTVSRKLNLPVIEGNKNTNSDEDDAWPSVDHWIRGIQNARFVVTDSFHGTCMSIVFRKPFVVVGNKARGLNRFISLLKMFCLEDRLITNSSDFNDSFFDSLNVKVINEILQKERDKSLSFLFNNLK